MTKDFRRRLEKLEAAQAEPQLEDVGAAEEVAALAHLHHVLRADATGAARYAPITDAEWAELERAGLVMGDLS